MQHAAEPLKAYETIGSGWVLMDVEMTEMGGITARREITDARREGRVVILTKKVKRSGSRRGKTRRCDGIRPEGEPADDT
jgi:DNA-binding NarL/FixJ family response regulator